MFCSLYFVRKREDMVPVGLNIAETMETGNIKNRGMTGATDVWWRKLRERLMQKIKSFSKIGWSTWILSLESVITLEQVNTLEVEKRRNVNNEQNFDHLCSHSETNWRQCCKLSLYANGSGVESAVYFWRWQKWRAMFITFFCSLAMM